MQEISKEFAEQTLSQSNSKKNWAIKLGFISFNGKIYSILNNLISKFELNCSHFDSKLKNRKYQLITKICPICSASFKTNKDHIKEKHTCSRKCANVFFSNQKHTVSSNQKRSLTLKNKQLKRKSKYCLECNIEMNNKYYCSNVCKNKSIRYKTSVSERIKKRIFDGVHSGWMSRLKITPSYPELYVIKLFDELDLLYVRELKCGKWFIDFANVKNKIALEIDGKQHSYPQRQTSDAEKDKYLIDNGWSVIRVKWRKIDKLFREHLISLLVNNF